MKIKITILSILLALCNMIGYAVTLPPLITIQQAQMLTLGTQTLDNNSQFGFCAAISGNFAVVGAPRAIIPNNPNIGAFYLYKKSGGLWQLVSQVPNTFVNDSFYGSFARSIDIWGNDIIVGSSPFATSDEGGSIHFFKINSNNTVTHVNTFNHHSVGRDFGREVKISRGIAVAPENPLIAYNCTNPAPLSVRTYKKSPSGQWSLLAIIPNVGVRIAGISIHANHITLARQPLTSTCANPINEIVSYRFNNNVWSQNAIFPNFPFFPVAGSMYVRSLSDIDLLYTRRAGTSGSIFGIRLKLNNYTNTIVQQQVYNDYVFSQTFIPPFPSGVSTTFGGVDFIGYEISGPNPSQNGYIRFSPNGIPYAIPLHNNRAAVIDVDGQNIIYCSNPRYSPNADDYRVMIGSLQY